MTKSNEICSRESIPLFLHIPKTGGTTLKHCIYGECQTNDLFGLENNFLHNGVYYYPTGFFNDQKLEPSRKIRLALKRPELGAVIGHFSFGIHQYLSKPCTYLTLLRNPVDRIISLYYHLNPTTSLEEFLTSPPVKEVDNDMVRRISGIDHKIGACSHALLETAKDNLHNYFSVVGLTERFDETLVLAKRKFNWKQTPNYTPGLVNKKRPRDELLPKKTLNLIKELNELDFKLYEYSTLYFEEQIAQYGSDFIDELDDFKARNEKYIEETGIPEWSSKTDTR